MVFNSLLTNVTIDCDNVADGVYVNRRLSITDGRNVSFYNDSNCMHLQDDVTRANGQCDIDSGNSTLSTQ